MKSTKQDYIRLAVIVIVFYLGLTYLPQMLGTCMDGDCGFTIGEIIISFAIPLAFIALPIVLEMLQYRKELTQALSDIGITQFSWTGIRIALVYSVPLLVFYPVVSLVTNSPVTMRPNWEWLVVNIILVNGLAEEVMMRGYIFRHLREGRSFWRAATLATAYFAAYHLPLMISQGLVLGFIAVIIAIPIGYLTAYSYERGNNTMWGPGLLHAVNNGLVMLLVLPDGIQPVASSLYMLLGIVVSALMLIRAYRSGYDRMQTHQIHEQFESPTVTRSVSQMNR